MAIGAPAEEVKGILAGHDEVLLLLRPDSLTVGVVAARKDGNEHLHKTHLASQDGNTKLQKSP